MNSKASDVSEGLIGRLWEAVTMEYSRQIGQRDKLDETSLGAEAADEIARLKAEIATLSPPLPSLEVERLRSEAFEEAAQVAISFDNCGTDTDPQHRIPCEIADAIRALSALPLDGGLSSD